MAKTKTPQECAEGGRRWAARAPTRARGPNEVGWAYFEPGLSIQGLARLPGSSADRRMLGPPPCAVKLTMADCWRRSQHHGCRPERPLDRRPLPPDRRADAVARRAGRGAHPAPRGLRRADARVHHAHVRPG